MSSRRRKKRPDSLEEMLSGRLAAPVRIVKDPADGHAIVFAAFSEYVPSSELRQRILPAAASELGVDLEVLSVFLPTAVTKLASALDDEVNSRSLEELRLVGRPSGGPATHGPEMKTALDVIRIHLGLDWPPHPFDDLYDLGADSLTLLAIVDELASAAGQEVELTEISTYHCAADICRGLGVG